MKLWLRRLRYLRPLSLRGSGTHSVAWQSQTHACTGPGRASSERRWRCAQWREV